jgi:type II secretion system protein H
MRISETGENRLLKSFSLIEMLVVLAILAVAAGAIIPRIGHSLERHELEQAAGRFAHLARTVRELAAARQETYILGLDLNRGAYSVGVISEKNKNEIQKVQASWLKSGRWSEEVKMAEFKAPEGVPATRGVQEIRFLPDGTSSGASMRFVCGTRSCAVVIHPHNGRVDCVNGHEKPLAVDQFDLGD